MIKAHPAYDSAAQAWRLGIVTNGVSSAKNLTGTGERWFIALNPLPLQAGRYDFSSVRFDFANTQSTNCDEGHFVIYKKTGSTFDLVTRFDITASLPSGSGAATITLSNVSLLAVAATDYYWGVALHGASGRASDKPGASFRSSSTGPAETYVWNGNSALPLTIPISSRSRPRMAARSSIRSRSAIGCACCWATGTWASVSPA